MSKPTKGVMLDLVQRVHDRRAQGMSIEDACKAEGSSVSTYRRWRREVGYRKPSAKGYVTMEEARDCFVNYPKGRHVYGNLILGPDYQDLKLCTAWRWCRKNPEAMSDLMPDDPLKFLRERGRA